jgi:hypothetical protein
MVQRVNGGILSGGFGTATLAYFTVTPGADLTGEVGKSNTALEAIVQTIQTRATTFIIGAIGSTEFRVATEPNGWTAATLETAIRALGTVNGKDLSLADAADFTF